MKIITDSKIFPESLYHSHIAIGNFDGLHLGHQALIENARKRAHGEGAKLGLLLFSPHPRRFFQPSLPPQKLLFAPLRDEILAGLGVDFILILPFDETVAGLSAEQFMEQVLVGRLHAKAVCVGENFHFGKGRGGDVETLKGAEGRLGFRAYVTKTISVEGGAVCSSTEIRKALQEGKPEYAALLLGRNWQVEGRVIKGDGRGSALGFATANIEMGEMLMPAFGIYAVYVHRGGEKLAAVASIGVNPTFGGDRSPRFEVHVFDLAEDLYGEMLRVEMVRFLRGEEKYASEGALVEQIQKDCQNAKEHLAKP